VLFTPMSHAGVQLVAHHQLHYVSQ
jgi:hypothetical protein